MNNNDDRLSVFFLKLAPNAHDEHPAMLSLTFDYEGARELARELLAAAKQHGPEGDPIQVSLEGCVTLLGRMSTRQVEVSEGDIGLKTLTFTDENGDF